VRGREGGGRKSVRFAKKGEGEEVERGSSRWPGWAIL
jgi:hypothetical protein